MLLRQRAIQEASPRPLPFYFAAEVLRAAMLDTRLSPGAARERRKARRHA